MTLVGDPGQASRPGALASWSDVLEHVPQHAPVRFVTLTINYRTPSEVMEVASRLLAVAAPAVEPSRSVRSTGEQPLFVATPPDRLLDENADPRGFLDAGSGRRSQMELELPGIHGREEIPAQERDQAQRQALSKNQRSCRDMVTPLRIAFVEWPEPLSNK
jgi:hypothetical protein